MKSISIYLFFASTMHGVYLPGAFEARMTNISLDHCARQSRRMHRIVVGIDEHPKVSSAKTSHVVSFCALHGKLPEYHKQYIELLRFRIERLKELKKG